MMEFTGERFHPTLHGDIRLEHYHRYHWCLPYIAGKRVLDIASGEGYGSAWMSETAAQVTGVDISPQAVAHAQAQYKDHERLGFLQGDAASIPLPDHCVDVVVSFETIEHHLRHEEMLSEIKRVLVDGGLLILSSPNKEIYSDHLAGGDHNPFHVKELYFSQLDELLAAHFENIEYYNQRFTAGSIMQPLTPDQPLHSLDIYTETQDGIVHRYPQQIPAMYFIAMASMGPLPILPKANALFSEIDSPFYDMQKNMVDQGQRIQHLDEELTMLRENKTNLMAVNEGVQQKMDQLQQQLRDAQNHLQAIFDSRSWKLVQAMRKVLGRK